ncbi:MAG: FHA domain-containing protein [Propionibacteriaceae bacterium]|jgi:S-DNA-T family DNA segregation ATPase FtsK/SpoIIIE|nr:FHA domain-containing protein [Propionibacteriaceae bacterium]
MRLKLTLRRNDGSSDDVMIDTDASTTIGEVAETLLRVDRRHVGTIDQATLAASLPGQDRPTVLSPRALVGEAWIGSGADVWVVDRVTTRYNLPDAQSTRATVRVETLKYDSSVGLVVAEHPLAEGTYLLGRGSDCDIRLDDPLVSHHHLRLDVAAQSTEVIDFGSANGTLVDGSAIQRLRIDNPTRMLVGDTWVTVVPSPLTEQIAQQPGPVPFTRPPRVEDRYAGETFEAPDPPAETEGQGFPFLALLAPILMGVGMYMMTQRLTSLLFVALTPVMLVGNFLTQKTQQRRRRKKDVARFEERLSSLKTALADQVGVERAVRLAEAPSTSEVYSAAMNRAALLWTRRPEHWSFLNVRLGTGTMPSRDTIETGKGRGALLPEFQERLDAVVDAHRLIEHVPIVENLFDAGALGLAGTVDQIGGVVDSALIQLTGLHSPTEMVVTALVSPTWAKHLQWLTWMPHTTSPTSPIEGHHLSTTATTATKLIAQLEGVISSRQKADRAGHRGAMKADDAAMERGADVGTNAGVTGTKSPLPAVVVLVSDELDIDQARLVQLAEQGPDAGVFLIWLSDQVAGLPGVCRTFVAVEPDQSYVGLVRLGMTITDATLEQVPTGEAMTYARRMAPVIDVGALVEDSGDIPRSVPLPTLLGTDLFAHPEAVIERWRQNQSIIDRVTTTPRKRASSLRALVGSAGVDPMTLDLRGQGPHALVGGTTGSGKSEFLQAWVLAMAAEYSPDRVTFLFVDYKGGAAFADCVKLPHCVGLVTDLSPHLVVRALTSLRAELHHREHLFQRKKAKDILELERRGDPECPPALVIVIDEFAALVGDVPEFVDGVVDVAQRGRSLGIHLVMATQRPAGVIKDNLRANTNLRVALRMADESDSQDVVEVKDAAHFDPSIPGRGVVKTGPGRVATFQSAYAGGWTTDEPEPRRVDIYRLAFSGLEKWDEPQTPGPASPKERDLGPNDQQRLVASAIAAHAAARLPIPRRPWLDSLPAVCPLPYYDPHDDRGLGPLVSAQSTDTDLLLGLADLPSRQAQLPVYFYPDQDGHLAIFGTSGSGKSVALRTIAASAGITPHGGPVHVYGLDFAAGGLRMLEGLPHVAGVVKAEETEKIISVFRTLQSELAARAEAFAGVAAASVSDYRRLSGDPRFPRILLLIDGFGSFREDFESGPGRIEWFEVFRDILAEGRTLGIHVVLTADRPGAVPTYVRSVVQRNLLLRMSDDAYLSFNAPRDVITATSPPGRGLLDNQEVQIAVIGATTDVAEQARITAHLGRAMARIGVTAAPPVRVLPASYQPSDLPDSVADMPVLGLDSIRLAPYGFPPNGVMLVAGPPGSGRSNALAAITIAMTRARPMTRCYLLAPAPSTLADRPEWTEVAQNPEQVLALATTLLTQVRDAEAQSTVAVIIESYAEFLQSAADKALVDLVKATRNSAHLLVAESETASWTSSWPLLAEVKLARRGLLLQPEALDGDSLLKTALPRSGKGEYPPGRGVWISRGKFVRVQLPLVIDGGR